MKDGSPRVTPTWVDIEDDIILINTAAGRIKQENISRDPIIALSIIDQDNQYDMVTVRGKVIEQINGDLAENILINWHENISTGTSIQEV